MIFCIEKGGFFGTEKAGLENIIFPALPKVISTVKEYPFTAYDFYLYRGP